MRPSGAGGSGRSGRAAAEPALRAEAQPCAICSVCASCGSIAERSWHGRQWRWRLRPRVARQAARRPRPRLRRRRCRCRSPRRGRCPAASVSRMSRPAAMARWCSSQGGSLSVAPTGAGRRRARSRTPRTRRCRRVSSSIRSGASPSPGYVRADSPLRRPAAPGASSRRDRPLPAGAGGRSRRSVAWAMTPRSRSPPRRVAERRWRGRPTTPSTSRATMSAGARTCGVLHTKRAGGRWGDGSGDERRRARICRVRDRTTQRARAGPPRVRGRGRGARSHGSLERTAAGLRPPRGTAADHGCRGRDRRRRVA